MKRLVALLVMVVFVFAASLAFAGDTATTGTSENGWQKTADWISSWSWTNK